jgi:hypothetical protein
MEVAHIWEHSVQAEQPKLDPLPRRAVEVEVEVEMAVEVVVVPQVMVVQVLQVEQVEAPAPV